MPHVGFILHPHALLAGLAIPAELFRAADEIHCARQRAGPRLRLTVASPGGADLNWLATVELRSLRSLDRLQGVDLLYLPPLWRKPVADTPAVLETLRRLAADGSLVCAVSTGAYPLAASGLLDGRAATTHWAFLDDFASRFPAVRLKRQHLITRAGTLYCTGSLNATADLTGHFIERFYGATVARLAETQFSPEVRRPALQQSWLDGEIGAQPDEVMAEAQRWLREHAGSRPDLDDLAQRLAISRRTLNRRFRAATGRTPVRFVQETRLEEASSLLRHTNLPIAEIAGRVGYDDPAHFATLYRRLTGQSPSGYRAAVRAKLFTPE